MEVTTFISESTLSERTRNILLSLQPPFVMEPLETLDDIAAYMADEIMAWPSITPDRFAEIVAVLADRGLRIGRPPKPVEPPTDDGELATDGSEPPTNEESPPSEPLDRRENPWRIDPAFSPASLPAAAKPWYDAAMFQMLQQKSSRGWHRFGAGDMRDATSGNQVFLGKGLANYAMSMIRLFWRTGDERIVNQGERILEAMQPTLRPFEAGGKSFLGWSRPNGNRTPLDDAHVLGAIGLLCRLIAENRSDSATLRFWAQWYRNEFEEYWWAHRKLERLTPEPVNHIVIHSQMTSLVGHHSWQRVGEILGMEGIANRSKAAAARISKRLEPDEWRFVKALPDGSSLPLGQNTALLWNQMVPNPSEKRHMVTTNYMDATIAAILFLHEMDVAPFSRPEFVAGLRGSSRIYMSDNLAHFNSLDSFPFTFSMGGNHDWGPMLGDDYRTPLPDLKTTEIGADRMPIGNFMRSATSHLAAYDEWTVRRIERMLRVLGRVDEPTVLHAPVALFERALSS